MKVAVAWLIALAALGCQRLREMPHAAESGGSGTVVDSTRDAFSQPSAWLSEAHKKRFFVGNSFFNLNWVSAPASVADRDGLGPLFNARSCSACHFKDGRSAPPEAGQAMSTMLLRVSVPGSGPHGAPVGDPVYGDQIQGSALPGVPAEADVVVDYEEEHGAFPDGQRYSLRRPHYRIERWGYGTPSSQLLLSPRVAPALIGLGLLEAVPAALLAALADPSDANHDGISGRQNQVLDVERKARAPGRFGWKAEQPSVVQQSAGAFLGDMGLTSPLFPNESSTDRQETRRGVESGGRPEVTADVLAAVGLYARSLAVPARRNANDPTVARGEDLFGHIGCALCHVPTLRTAPLADLPELPTEEIHPYSDLLLHDLGEGLSDGRPTFAAQGPEWRTPPLWGLGLVKKVNAHSFLLHDGRARTAEEAVLWHGGEAQAARVAYMKLEHPERGAVLAFLESL